MFSCEDHNGVNGSQPASDSSAGKGSRQVKGASLVLKQFYALLVKRFHHATRSQKDFLAQVRGLKARPNPCILSEGTAVLTSSHGHSRTLLKLDSDGFFSICSRDQPN